MHDLPAATSTQNWHQEKGFDAKPMKQSSQSYSRPVMEEEKVAAGEGRTASQLPQFAGWVAYVHNPKVDRQGH